MRYGQLLNRAFEIVKNHLYLILVGVLAAFSGMAGRGTPGINFNFGGDDADFFSRGMPEMPEGFPPQMGPGGMPNFEPFGVAALVFVAILGVLALLVGIALWVVGTIARGGLVDAVDQIEEGESASFGSAWRSGMDRALPLLGISLLPAIPALLLAIVGLGTAASAFTMFRMFGQGNVMPFVGAGLGSLAFALTCIAVPLMLVLALLRTFAERACMLEDTGVIESYRRGASVLLDNLGEAVVLFIIQIAIGFGISLVLFLPSLVIAFCFLLWPLLLIIDGAIAAYFSTLWTLAWRQWTGSPAQQPATTV